MRTASILGAILLSTAAEAQRPLVIARDGWEAFPLVEYIGGDATMSKKVYGMLVLRDSSLALHQCRTEFCHDDQKRGPFTDKVLWSVQLRHIKEVNTADHVRGASVTNKVLIGMLAPDRPEEFVGLVYETLSSAEAPMFKTQRAQSAAIAAKIRFWQKRLGIFAPAAADTVSSLFGIGPPNVQ